MYRIINLLPIYTNTNNDKFKHLLFVGNALKSFALTLIRIIVLKFDNHIILDDYNNLLETIYNLSIENSLMILYDPKKIGSNNSWF